MLLPVTRARGSGAPNQVDIVSERANMNDETMTKADLVEEVVRVTELPRKESEVVVETIFESIIKALQSGDKIEIRGFGSFRTRERQGRVGRNPKTGERVEVPAKKIPFFKPSKELKDYVNTQAAGAASDAPQS
jgi:integration host factor subunit beta